MFGTIRKHQTWLWVFLVAVMSVSLVAFFTTDVFVDGSGRRRGGEPDLGSINGRPIDREEYLAAQAEIRIASFLHTGKWPGDDETSKRRMESETISRVFIIHKLDEMDIEASDKAVGLMMHDQLKDYEYAKLEKEILRPNNLTLADYERYVRHEAAIRQLISAASVSARLVSPADAEIVWRKEYQEASGQIACFWTSNYLSKVVITNGAVANYYTNQMNFRYRLPERLIIGYVAFPASNYLADADSRLAKLTNLNEIVSDIYFRSRGNTNAWTDTNGVPLPEAAAKEKIQEELRQNEALIAARRVANEFGNELITQPDPNKLETLEKLTAAKGLQLRVTQPFDSRTNGLEEFEFEPAVASRSDEGPPEMLRDVVRNKAFTLTDERPISFSPVLGRHAVYLIARKTKVPTELQPFDKIQEKVTTDYKNAMALDSVRKAGMAFHTNLTNGLMLKKSFNEICAAEKVPVIDVPPFSSATRALTNSDPRINLRQLQGQVDNLEVGKATVLLPAQPGTEGGYIFYLSGRPPIDPLKLKEALPDFVNQLRTYRQNEAFQQWFRKQAEQAKLSGPKKETSIGAQN